MLMRYALVAGRSEQIAAYLPDNYQVLGSVDGQTVIGGRDAAGWTLDAYVLPRLGLRALLRDRDRPVAPGVQGAARLVSDPAGLHPPPEQLVDPAEPMTICQLDQRLGARPGAGARAGEHRRGCQRELRVDERQLALQSQTSAPPRRGA